jgi:hypothetical protein
VTDLFQRRNDPDESVRPATPTGGVGRSVDVVAMRPGSSSTPVEPSRPHGTLAGRASLFVAGAGLTLVAAHAVSIPTPPCPLRWATGFPCPFCGCTHIARELVSGHVGVVAANDPAGLVFAALVGVAVVAQLVALTRRSQGPAFLETRTAAVVLVAVLAAHWVTTIVTGGMLST